MFKRFLTCSGIILLNLTGLGLGFLVLRRWNRWRAHIIITAGILLLAVMLKAYQSPLAWSAVVAVWVLLTAVEGCQRARSVSGLPSAWLVFLLGFAACGLTAGGIAWYELSAADAFSSGVQAYRSGDCQSALDRFGTFDGLFRLSLSPLQDSAAARSVQCRMFLFAVQEGENGYPAQALQSLGQLASAAPDALPSEVIRAQVVHIRQDAAMRLAAQGNYQQGIELLLSPSQVELTVDQLASLRELAAQITIAWGDQVYMHGDSEQAIHIFQQVLDSYVDTQQVALARQHLISAYLALAESNFQQGNLEGALSVYLFLQGQYQDMPGVQLLPPGRLAELYTRLAEASRVKGQYAAAIKYDEALLQVVADRAVYGQIHLKLADLYLVWAGELRKQGQFDQVVEIYQKLVNDFGGTPAAAAAAAQIPFVRLAWVDDLYVNGQFDLALEKLVQMQLDYPKPPMSAHVAEKFPEVYLAWGQSLLTHGKYADAIQKYQLVMQYSRDAKVLARANMGIRQAQNVPAQ